MENIERNNESRHTLYTKLFGSITIQEPDGWANDTEEFSRDKDSRAILSKTTINLRFFGDGAEWLSTLFKSLGIQEKVFLTKHEKDPNSINERWTLRYVQEIDMGTFKEDSRTGAVTVKATEGGLYEDIKNRISDKYDIVNKISADGVDIGYIKTYPFEPQPRGLFLESLLSDSQNLYRINSERYRSSYSETTRTVPLKVVYNSSSPFLKTPSNTSEALNSLTHDQNYNIGTTQNVGDIFYWRSDIKRTIRIKFELDFVIDKVKQNEASFEGFSLELRKMELVGDNDKLKERTIIDSFDPTANVGVQKSYTLDQEIELLEGESLSLVFSSFMLGTSGTFDAAGYMDIYFNISVSRLVVEDKTDYDSTVSRCIKPFDFFERIIAKITGKKDLFRSSIFGEGGEYEHIVLDNGFWARGFPDSVTESEGNTREIQFVTSFKDAFESMNYLEPLTWFTEIEGSKEVVRIEKATHTMKNFVGVRLASVDNIEHEASKPDFFSKITIGHKKSMEYEEINGLDEYNGKSEFGTHITRNDSEYEISSEYRFDSVAYELVRRKSYLYFPKEDTPRDSHIFMHDAKFVGGVYTHNLWSDHFDNAPSGMYSPDTAWNLRLTPMNRLYYGHGYSVARGLYHYPENKVRFNSSNANQNVKTTMNGVTLYEGGENSFILVKNLGKPRIEPEKTTLTFKLTRDIEDQLKGSTLVNDEYVPNFFGLFEYKEKGEIRYGRLVKLTTDEESKLTLMNAKL